LISHQTLENLKIVAVNKACGCLGGTDAVMLTAVDVSCRKNGLNRHVAAPRPDEAAVIGNTHESVDYKPDSIHCGGAVI
jgi:hypothetical protein